MHTVNEVCFLIANVKPMTESAKVGLECMCYYKHRTHKSPNIDLYLPDPAPSAPAINAISNVDPRAYCSSWSDAIF